MREPDPFVQIMEKSLSDGDFNRAAKEVSDGIAKGRTPDAANQLLAEVTTALHRQGRLPALTCAFVTANFNRLDLDGNGVVDANELKKIDELPLYNRSLTAIDQQMVKYVRHNFDDMRKAHNGWGTESGISRQDIPAFENKMDAAFKKTSLSQRLNETFGRREAFVRLDTDRDGYLSVTEFNNGIKNGGNGEERALIGFMRDNKTEIMKASNDQKLWESKISREDIRVFASNNRMPALPSSVTVPNYYDRQAVKELNPDKFKPTLLAEFGRLNFKGLDLNDNGYINRLEAQRFSNSSWAVALNPGERKALDELNRSLELVQKSHSDEWWWYKDVRGVTAKDLADYNTHQLANRADIPTTPGDHNLSLTIGGVKRDYMVHIPPSYDGKESMPVLYFYHYFTGDADKLAAETKMSDIADREKFIVVYPNAEGWLPQRYRQWNLNNNPSYRVDEVSFASSLMDTIENKLNVDKSRMYLAGYSNGGMIAHELAAKFSDRLAAMACVSGCQNPGLPAPTSALSVLMIHGTKDKLVPINGRSFTPLFPKMKSLEESRKFWCETNQTDTVTSEKIASDVVSDTFTNSKTGTQVKVMTMLGSGHGYAGGTESFDGNLNTSINASEEIWKFLSRHKRPVK